jgi:hypothetical protein
MASKLPPFMKPQYWEAHEKKYASQRGRYPPALPQIAPKEFLENGKKNKNYALWKKQVSEYLKFLLFLQNPRLWQIPKTFEYDNLILYSSKYKTLNDAMGTSGFAIVYPDRTLVSRVGYAYITKKFKDAEIAKGSGGFSFAEVAFKPKFENYFQQYANDIVTVGSALYSPYLLDGYDIGFFTRDWAKANTDSAVYDIDGLEPQKNSISWENTLKDKIIQTRKNNSYHDENAPLYFEEDESNIRKYNILL